MIEDKAGDRTDTVDFVHTGPGTLAGHYMRMFWQPVYRAADLLPGRTIMIRIMNEDFTLYRGEGGVPHLVAPRCAHRRTQLSVGWVEGDCIRCFYHGWRYDGAGNCVERPAEHEHLGKVRIRSYPTREYLGAIFAYLGEGEPPPLPRFPELEGEGVLEVESPFVRACNFFNDLDNACDPLHVAFVHQASRIDINRFFETQNIQAEESGFGVTIKMRRTIAGGGLRLNQFGMPNIQLLRLPPVDGGETAWREFVSWRVPVDDEHYLSININLFHVAGEAAIRFRQHHAEQMATATAASNELAERVIAGKATIADVGHRIFDIVRLQDDVVLTAQGAIPDRENEWLGSSDVGVVLLRRIWRRELRALARGNPLKRWSRPAGLVATSGLATP